MMNNLVESHPLYGKDPTRNGSFGYVLPERKLGNYELVEFFKLAHIAIRYARWYTRSGSGVIQPDWCWQNYCAGFEYGIDSGKVFVSLMCAFLQMPEDEIFISYQYGRSSIQFTFTQKVEQYILGLLSVAGLL